MTFESQEEKNLCVLILVTEKKRVYVHTHTSMYCGVSQVSNTDVQVGLPTTVIEASRSLTKPQHLQQ